MKKCPFRKIEKTEKSIYRDDFITVQHFAECYNADCMAFEEPGPGLNPKCSMFKYDKLNMERSI